MKKQKVYEDNSKKTKKKNIRKIILSPFFKGMGEYINGSSDELIVDENVRDAFKYAFKRIEAGDFDNGEILNAGEISHIAKYDIEGGTEGRASKGKAVEDRALEDR